VTTTRPPLTIGRQVLAGYVATFVVILALVVVAVAALGNLGDAKDRVIERDLALVVGANRARAVAAEKAVDNRTYALTGDERYRDLAEERRTTLEDLLAQLDQLVVSDAGIAFLDRLRTENAQWDAEAEDVFELIDTLDGEEPPIDVLEERLFPGYETVNVIIEDFTELQSQRIASSTADADDAADTAVLLVLLLGAAALVVTIVIGTWVTRRSTARLTEMALSLDAAAAEILASTTEQVAGAAQQATAVQETVATVEELVQAANQSAERARAVADSAQHSNEIARLGTEAVSSATTGMATIREQVESLARTVLDLAERAQAISDIVDSVDEIAEQTHLLALNASIEAARAGEHGRGFAVVASEVRGLADQAKRSTGRVAEILGEIQRRTNGAVLATEEGTKSVAEGARRVEETGRTINDLAEAVSSAALAAEQIAASSNQQAAATTQIGDAMRNIDDVMEQNVAAARQVEQAASDLGRVAADLKSLVGAG
jgi:methyl-accepting chemotaxis protein